MVAQHCVEVRDLRSVVCHRLYKAAIESKQQMQILCEGGVRIRVQLRGCTGSHSTARKSGICGRSSAIVSTKLSLNQRNGCRFYAKGVSGFASTPEDAHGRTALRGSQGVAVGRLPCRLRVAATWS